MGYRHLNYGREIIREYATKAVPFQTVLDLGAGSGTDLDIYKAVNPSAKLIAVESHAPNIETLRSKGIECHSLDIERERLPFADGSIDIVTTNQVLEHVKEVFWILHEITRVLKIGGKLVIGVPNLASLHNRVLLLLGRQPTSIRTNSAHVRGYTKPGMMILVGLFPGYKLECFKGSNFYPFPPALSSPLAALFPSMAVGIFFCFEKTTEYSSAEFIRYPGEHQLETNYFVG